MAHDGDDEQKIKIVGLGRQRNQSKEKIGSFKSLNLLSKTEVKPTHHSSSRIKLPKIKNFNVESSYKFLPPRNSDIKSGTTLQPFK